jgi:hypothetical protein
MAVDSGSGSIEAGGVEDDDGAFAVFGDGDGSARDFELGEEGEGGAIERGEVGDGEAGQGNKGEQDDSQHETRLRGWDEWRIGGKLVGWV